MPVNMHAMVFVACMHESSGVQAECQAEADRDKERYKEELEAWRAAHPAAAAAAEATRGPRSAGRAARAATDSKPKKAPSAYILFLKDFRCAGAPPAAPCAGSAIDTPSRGCCWRVWRSRVLCSPAPALCGTLAT